MRKRLVDLLEFGQFLLQRFQADRGTHSAAALTYTTLFAVVPMMTVTFAMLSAIPAFQGVGEQIQSFIFRNFVPSTGEAVQVYLQARVFGLGPLEFLKNQLNSAVQCLAIAAVAYTLLKLLAHQSPMVTMVVALIVMPATWLLGLKLGRHPLWEAIRGRVFHRK